MEAISNNWSEIRLRINIDATIEKIYNAWTSQAGLESWFLREAKAKDQQGSNKKETDSMVKGDTYKWLWHGFPDDTVLTGKVLDSNGKDRFSFSFSMDCPVTISIYKEQGQVICELVERNIPVDAGPIFKHYLSNTTGWTFYLTNLKSVLEGGLDMRNFDENLKNVITA
ncbi:MAG: SRPBCC domain-containing protein [Bacteroidota bacterium]